MDWSQICTWVENPGGGFGQFLGGRVHGVAKIFRGEYTVFTFIAHLLFTNEFLKFFKGRSFLSLPCPLRMCKLLVSCLYSCYFVWNSNCLNYFWHFWSSVLMASFSVIIFWIKYSKKEHSTVFLKQISMIFAFRRKQFLIYKTERTINIIELRILT